MSTEKPEFEVVKTAAPIEDTYVLAVPYGETVDGWFFQAFAQFMSWVQRRADQGLPTRYAETISVRGGPAMSANRCQIANLFLSTNSRWLCMIDADQHFDPDVWEGMIETMLHHDLEVLAGISTTGESERDLATNIYRRASENGYYVPLDAMPPAGKIIRVDAVGAACVVVDREVFYKTGPRWFHHVTRDEAWSARTGLPPDDDQYGEDISFFGERCREAGVKVWVHTDCVFPHSKSRLFDPRLALPRVVEDDPPEIDLKALKTGATN